MALYLVKDIDPGAPRRLRLKMSLIIYIVKVLMLQLAANV